MGFLTGNISSEIINLIYINFVGIISPSDPGERPQEAAYALRSGGTPSGSGLRPQEAAYAQFTNCYSKLADKIISQNI